MLRCRYTSNRGSRILASKAKPFERFGSFLLFKKLESDSLSELWRAAEIENEKLGPTVALRRFTGGNRAALKAAADDARAVASALTGTTVVRGQKVGTVGDIPYIAHEYAGGRTLKTVVEKAKGSNSAPGTPIPVDQALAIVEKLASSCEMLANVRYQGNRLVHGALIPQFVWISEEGEVRTAGQQFGKGIVASLSDRAAAVEYGSYFAPEYRSSATASRGSDVFALGSLLFLMLTGKEAPHTPDTASLRLAIENARLAGRDEAIPADIRPILEKTLHADAAERFPSAVELRQSLDKLLNGGEYAPTTFNLAFYLHSLLKKDMELEASERPREEAVDVAPYLAPEPVPAAAVAAAAPAAAQAVPFASFAAPEEHRRSKAPFIAVAAGLVAVAGGAWVALAPKAKSAPVAAAKTAAPMNTASAITQPPVIEPIVAAAPATGTAPAAPMDPEARKKMIEDAVSKRLQEEMMKLQEDYNKQLQKQQVMQPSSRPAESAPAQIAAAPARRDDSVSASQLDQQRRAQSLPSTPEPAASQPQQAAPAVADNTPAQSVAQPQVVAVREGDLVAINDVDSTPELRSPVRPVYPPMAAKRKLEATIIVSALINENGRVTDVRILRGDSARMGFEEAATRAVRAASFTSPMKDGKRVKTWKPLPIVFRLQ